jgi:hypothetical protein
VLSFIPALYPFDQYVIVMLEASILEEHSVLVVTIYFTRSFYVSIELLMDEWPDCVVYWPNIGQI